MKRTGRPRGIRISEQARQHLSAAMVAVWQDPSRRNRIKLLRKLSAQLSPEKKAAYRFYRAKGFSAVDALFALGILKRQK